MREPEATGTRRDTRRKVAEKTRRHRGRRAQRRGGAGGAQTRRAEAGGAKGWDGSLPSGGRQGSLPHLEEVVRYVPAQLVCCLLPLRPRGALTRRPEAGVRDAAGLLTGAKDAGPPRQATRLIGLLKGRKPLRWALLAARTPTGPRPRCFAVWCRRPATKTGTPGL